MKLCVYGGFSSYCILSLLLVSCIGNSFAKKDKDLYCGACLAMASEIDTEISRVDKKKKIQVGSYRIDSNGNQDLREVPYARSDVHLTEVFENLCSKMNNYAKTTEANDGEYYYLRKTTINNSPISLKNMEDSSAVRDSLRRTCENLLEDHEEEMFAVFKETTSDAEEKICVHDLGLCSSRAPTNKMMAYAVAAQAALTEQMEMEKKAEEERLQMEKEEELSADEDGDLSDEGGDLSDEGGDLSDEEDSKDSDSDSEDVKDEL